MSNPKEDQYTLLRQAIGRLSKKETPTEPLPPPPLRQLTTEEETLAAINRVVDSHDSKITDELLFKILEKADGEIILTPGVLAALKIGTTENVLAILQDLKDCPIRELSELGEKYLREGVKKEFPLSGDY